VPDASDPNGSRLDGPKPDQLPVAMEFLRLAAQWRAMAGRVIFLGHLDAPSAVAGALDAIALPPGGGGGRLAD